MINKLIEIINQANITILEIYNSEDFNVEFKSDNSPLTKADKAANEIIVKGLAEYFPDIPVISEEEKEISYEIRREYKKFFLVDPLDGTKEFIKRNGEFTVNIALIENSEPILGIVSAPVLDTVYYGSKENGAFKIEKGTSRKISVNNDNSKGVVTVQSRSHSGYAEKEFYGKYNVTDSISKGSSLKFCMLAEGKAHLYYRSGPTMEWDTAAGQAVLEAAGGYVFTDKKRFVYNKENLLNPGFVASSFDLYE
jgi:3'(2'), 5'-bisphosphate nucleotidase